MRQKRGLEPFHLLALIAVAGASLAVTGTLLDINDVFWHILIGRQVLDGVPFSDLGSNFSAVVQSPDWRTGAWGSEVLMAQLYDWGGWTLLVLVMRIGSVLAISLILFFGILRRYPSRAGVPAFTLAMVATALGVEERPQSLSFIFIAIAAVIWIRAIEDANAPRWWWLGALAMVWANLHGLWVVLPAVLALTVFSRMLDHGLTDRTARSLLYGTLASLVGGCISPLGLHGLLLPVQVRSAASVAIVEWQPTVLFTMTGLPLLLGALSLVFLVGRVRPVRRADLLFTVVVVLFGLTAIRNITPAVILMSPLLASLTFRALGSHATARVSVRERRILRWSAISISVAGTTAIIVALLVRPSGPSEQLPVQMAGELRSVDGPVRLLNDYNLSGVSLFYGGDQVQVGVDGRVDYYGKDYVNRYQDAISYGFGLNQILSDSAFNAALLPVKSGAVELLKVEGWVVDVSDDNYVLLLKR